jgi:uncharacterized protein (DUF1684 family)
VSRKLNWIPVLMAGALVACGGQVSVGAGGGGGGIGVGAGMSKGQDPAYVQSIEDWYAARIKRLTADDGWLTLVGLFPLTNGTHTFGAAKDNEFVLPAGAPEHAGRLVVQDTLFTLEPAPNAGMTLKEVPVAGTTPLASDARGDPSKVQMGSMQFYVIDRAPNRFLRVKDANSPTRANFKSIDRYAVTDQWRFDAVFEPYNPPHLIKVPNVLGYEDEAQCPGVLKFKRKGQTFRIEPIAREGDELSIVFGDATSGHETYGGGRELYVPMPGPDNKTVIDFNKAYNPPCVFTVFATCPLPTRENVLPFKVEAGEKSYGDPALHMHPVK